MWLADWILETISIEFNDPVLDMDCKAVTCQAEQFRATRFWHTIVTAVREELPVGRHRKGLKNFEDCFLGDEAVSWTMNYIEQNRDAMLGAPVQCDRQRVKPVPRAEITREKVTLLLQKFVEQKIIKDVHSRGEPFRDSARHLYIFNKENVVPLGTFTAAVVTFKESCCSRNRGRNGSLGHVSTSCQHFFFSLFTVSDS